MIVTKAQLLILCKTIIGCFKAEVDEDSYTYNDLDALAEEIETQIRNLN